MSEKSERARREEEILEFWKKNKIFDKSLEKKSPKGEFVFYEGPPTANGRPGIHHLEARSFKDAIPRYKTMRGYHVRRKAGWDTHGLPVELEVEKQLGISSKKEIEGYGVAKFNDECKKNVWKYVDEWQDFTQRIGYWVDLVDPYVTYHNSYIESVWGVVGQVDKRGLLYKDYKVVPWCPRCGTALSSHELAQGYEDVKDLSVYAKFRIVGFPDAYFLAWTTTTWTLPGNVALAVGKDIIYVEAKVGEEVLVLAKDKLSLVEGPYEVLAEHRGEEMVGMEYEPLYPFFKEARPEGIEKAYKVYTADFVNTDDGTGIVHTAVMYGQDDFALGTQAGLPKHHLVDESGHFVQDAGFLSGKFVKAEETAVEIIKDLAHRGLLFKKEKYAHSYPHCWRCKTPLIYYARDSWYIRMSALRDELVAENEKINWEPAHIKEGRFGEWLREVKDWALSRERYWGTPLPVWESASGEKLVISSIEELRKHTKSNGNTFVFVRHGEADHNVKGVCSSDPTKDYRLTEKGKEEVKKAASKIKTADIVYTSPFVRAKETADILASELGVKEIIQDERLGDLNFGELNERPFSEYLEYEEKNVKSYNTPLPGGESYLDAKRRFGEFLYETDSKYDGKVIVVSTHGMGIEASAALIEGADMERSKEILDNISAPTGEVFEFKFVPLPHNSDYELDLHKPYIDDVVLEKGGEEYRRTKEVMDVWLDSGAMPFAQDSSKVLYPADFISEAIDQTRGWFYTLHAVGALMGRGKAYKNVISLGHILDKEGKKMSKSVGNVVNPWEMLDKYGADTLRLWMYSVNQPGDSKNFDERSVDEIQKKVFNLLDNVYNFYKLYEGGSVSKGNVPKSTHILDRWILARLDELNTLTTEKLENYQLLEPVRALREFVDDLSTWYLRRSRERIKVGERDAVDTLHYVLKTTAKLMAPFAPFYAEDLYQKLKGATDPESVHLEEWPKADKGLFGFRKSNDGVIKDMKEVRRLVSLALDERQKANIKVRQPLAELRIKNRGLGEEYVALMRDEVNVKKVVQDKELAGEVELDTHMTPELEEEGRLREEIRFIQDLRKEKGLSPSDVMTLDVPGEKEGLYDKYREEIQTATNVKY